MSSEYVRQIRLAPFLSKKPKKVAIFALIILLVSLSTSILPALLRSNFPGVYPVAGVSNNVLGVVCGYGASNPAVPFPSPITSKDGDITTPNSSCEWAGDVDGDGSFDPLVSDNPSLGTPASGGGFTADIVVTNLNAFVNGFDLTLDYNTTVLNAVTIDQSGLLFGGNVGCGANPSCSLTAALSIDQTLGEVRLAQAILGVTAGPGGTCDVIANPGCTSPNQELFRIRFDIVGTGRGFINFSTDSAKNVITSGPSVLVHTSQNGVLSTSALFNLLNGQTTGAFNASWTFSPNLTPGSAVTFTAANAICTYCTAPFTYNWDFSSLDSPTYVAKIDATGKTATVTPPPPVINRVTLTVTDSAAHSISATRRLPLKAVVAGPTTQQTPTAVGPFTSKWFGGVVTTTGGYSGLWRFCPGTGLSHPVCSSGPLIVSQAPGSITQTNSVASVSWSFAGFYNDLFSVSDTAVSQISATPNTVVVPVPVNVTVGTPAYTVAVTPDKTTINAGQSVTFTATVTYAATYPPASKSTAFNYAFNFGDGGTDTINGGGLSVTDTHAFNTGGNFIVKVTPRETSATAPSQIQENGYSSAITVIPPLAADFSFSPPSPTSGQTVTFTSTVTGGNTPYTFAWNFADGTTSALASPTHAFTATGTTPTTFHVSMTVTDSTTPTAQTKTIIHDVVVSPAAFDFGLGTPSPSGLTATQGTTSPSSSITATLSAGTTTPVTFSASGLPTGVTAIFTNSPCSPSCTVMVSFTATATATLGPATVSIDASGGGKMHSTTISLTVQAPTQVPTVIVNTPTPDPANTGATVTVTFTVSSTVTVTGITVDWGDSSTPDALAGTATSDNHVYASTGIQKSQTFTITVSATSSAGPGSAHTTETVNDRLPVVIVTNVSPNPANTGALVTVTFTASDPDGTISSLTVNWGDSSAPDTLSGTATSDAHTYTVAGPFTITVTATDNSGSTGHGTGSITVNAVNAPTVTVNNPTPNPANTGATVMVTFAVSSTVTVTGITVDWGDGTTIDSLAGTATSDMHVYASTGTSTSHVFTITVTATNGAGPGAGHTSETVNDRPPVVAVTNVSPNPALTGQLVTVTFAKSDPDGAISSISVDWGDGTAADTLAGAATSDTHAYTIAGPFTITVTATDNSGSTGHGTGSITVNVPIGVPTVTVNAPTPNPANTGATVTVTFTVSSTVTVTGIKVDWGDGSAPDALPGTAASDNHVYASTGTQKSQAFTITVTATNSVGPGSGTAMETVNDRGPVASFTFSPNSPSAGQTVNFDASASSDPDGTIAIYSWDFGDGTTGTGVTTTHTYNPTTTTSFTVMLTVTDNSANTGSISHSITVTVTITITPPVVTISSIAPNPATTGQTVTVTFAVSSTAPVTGITVDWGDGTTPDALSGIATTDTHVYSIAGSFSVKITATNSAGPGSATAMETITAVTSNRILLTFKGFDIDDCDNNVGQLNVLVNNNLVANLPPCPQPTDDNLDFMNKFVSFGPFDITSFVVQGENTLVFISPSPGHFGLILNVTIRQGDTILLHVKGPRFVSGSHPVTLTFSNPPLTVTSFTVGPTPVLEGVQVTFTATFTGGTGPFTCAFTFGDESPAVVVTTSTGTCSATHAYTDDGVFFARVKIIGQATSDVVRVPLQVTVQEQDDPS